MINVTNSYSIKITIGTYSLVESVIYYRSNHKLDHINKWKWYYEYLAALVKINNPRKTVVLYIGHQDVKVGSEYVEEKTKSLLRHKRSALIRLKKGVINDDLFSFKSTANEEKINQLENDIKDLENGVFNYYIFPEYINSIKIHISCNTKKE